MKAQYSGSNRNSCVVSLVIFTVVFLLNAGLLSSQSLVVTYFDADGNGDANATQNCPPPIGPVVDAKDHLHVPWIQGGTTWFGVPYDYISALSYGVKVRSCGTVSGHISAHCYVGGDGTNTMLIDWYNWAAVKALLEPSYHAHANSLYWFNVTIQIMPGGGYNVGDPIELFFQYHFSGAGITDHEGVMEDPLTTINTLDLNGNSLIGNLYNFVNPPDVKGWRRETTNGSMMVTVGDTLRFDFHSDNKAVINIPGNPLAGGQWDDAESKFRGKITLSLDSIPLPLQYSPTYHPRIEFSLNIGSDAELSDPNQNGNEVFDPGDAYLMNGPFMVSAQNGVKDDAAIFGFDPAPDPFNPASAVPVGSGLFQPGLYFDLDGMDNMQTSLLGLSYGPGVPSISYFADSLVFLAEYLLISYDDDQPLNWAGSNAVPVNSQSPLAFDTYGRTSKADEVIAVDMDPYNVPSFPFTIDSLWSEANIHPNLAPNPDLDEQRDNDVNALNYFPNQYIDGHFYFSVSHEATFNHPIVFGALNPGSVYQLLGVGNFVEVVNPVVHLGIADGVDLNAISFGWVFDSIQARLGLALLFSVDMDDWTTPQDESGGLDPSVIYFSFLDGTHREFSSTSFRDNIDAITIVPHSFNGYALPTPGCSEATSLMITVSGTDAVLSWNEPVPPPVNGYEIELTDQNGVTVLTDVVPAGTNAYFFTGLTPGYSYTALVRSLCAGGLIAEVSIDFTTMPQIAADYGDAPEGELAYISPIIIGNFPTCENTGPLGSFIRHEPNPGLFFGPTVDYELDGNAGFCPVFNNQYNQDECFQDGDAGLIVPTPYTIVGLPGSETIVSCVPDPSEPWKTCRMAVWGVSVDIHVENMLPGDAYFNLLIDWDQNGEWGGNMTCTDGSVSSEHAVTNFIIPSGFSGPLSQLSPPGFRIGPNTGYVWTRFTITEIPVQAGWTGTGTYDFGETEDYLIALADPLLQDAIFINNTTFGAGFDDCDEAFDLIEISDSEFEPGSSFIAVAGNTVRVLPESHFKSGAYALLKIDQDGNFCSNYKGMLNVDEAIDKPSAQIPNTNEPLFRVYPNPTSGIITIELLDFDIVSISSVEIYNIMGERIHLDRLVQLPLQINLSDQKPGLYLVSIRYENEIWIKKLILY